MGVPRKTRMLGHPAHTMPARLLAATIHLTYNTFRPVRDSSPHFLCRGPEALPRTPHAELVIGHHLSPLAHSHRPTFTPPPHNVTTRSADPTTLYHIPPSTSARQCPVEFQFSMVERRFRTRRITRCKPAGIDLHDRLTQFPNCATYMRVVCMSAIPQIHFAKTARFTAVTFPSPCGATLWTSPITRTHSIIVNFLNYEPVFACGTQLPLLQRARTHAPVHNQPPSTC